MLWDKSTPQKDLQNAIDCSTDLLGRGKRLEVIKWW